MCKNDEGIVMPNFAALRAAVFPLSTKNLRGGGYLPPPSVRGLRGVNYGVEGMGLPSKEDRRSIGPAVAEMSLKSVSGRAGPGRSY